jgi:hypothetical protein
VDAAVAAFQELVDYAGLYPPASLPLDEVVQKFARYRAEPVAWMLGRLIVPAERLVECDALAAAHGARPDSPWPVSVLAGGVDVLSKSMAALAAFGARTDTVVSVKAIEAAASSADAVRELASSYPAEIDRFIEIPIDADPAPLLDAIAEAGCGAKIRTGGVTADRIPSTRLVSRLLARAATAGVPIKATAGLHHAIRADRRLTYAPDSPRGVMHGFANVVFAAALLSTGKIDEDLADALLDDDRSEVFKFGGRAGSWLNVVLTYSEFAHARHALLRSVGSCSFEEPVAELRELGWIT